MEADCIPSGMELFPAADEEQFIFIKKIIDDCDYYLLIIGGKYGSTTSEGISFTEKEYDYAIEKGLKVIAFVHSNPETLTDGKYETDPGRKASLDLFRARVSKGRLVKHWSKADDLPGLVALSLHKTIKMFPAVGWVRANRATNEETLSELDHVRKENEKIRQELRLLKDSLSPNLQDIATLDEEFTFVINAKVQKRSSGGSPYTVDGSWTDSMSWRNIFGLFGPQLLDHPNDTLAQRRLSDVLAEHFSKPKGRIDDEDFQTLKIQLRALKFVEVELAPTSKGGTALFWRLTPHGDRMMTEFRYKKTAAG